MTPGTAARLRFMTRGQAPQYQFRTASFTVVSPAKAAAASTPAARVIETSVLVIGGFLSRFEDQRCKKVEGQRPSDKDRRQNEAEHHQPVRQRLGAGRALRARDLARPVNQPVAISEANER